MPEFIRAYIVIISISLIAFFYAKKIYRDIIPLSQFNQWRRSWFILTSLSFLSFNYWVGLVVSFIYLLFQRVKLSDATTLYLAVLFAVPPIAQHIPGFGLINYLIEINYLRMLSIALLLPIVLKSLRSPNTLKFGKIKTDFYLVIYLFIEIALQFRDTTFTDALRSSITFSIDVFIPYYAVSRSIKNIEDYKIVFAAILFACIAPSLIGFFEMTRKWLLYSTIEQALNIKWGYGSYLARDTSLRAIASFGHPIIFGYCMTVGLGAYLYLRRHIKSKLYKTIALGIILIGLISPLSRGPWVGALVMFSVYLALGKNALVNLSKLAIVGIFSFTVATQLPGGEKLINLIPFVGKTEVANIEYRQRLIDASILVVSRYPLFGNVNFRQEPEMKKMVQGEGIIDIVNTYVSIALSIGYVGLFSFLGIFISGIVGTYRTIKAMRDKDSDIYQIGILLIAILAGIMVTITTVGNQLVIPAVYYSIIALMVNYNHLAPRTITSNQQHL